MRATGFTYNGGMPCYWKVTTNMTGFSGSEVFRITVNYSFAASLYAFTGDSVQIASN